MLKNLLLVLAAMLCILGIVYLLRLMGWYADLSWYWKYSLVFALGLVLGRIFIRLGLRL